MAESNERDGTASEDLDRVSREIAGRLTTLGIELTGRERPDDLVRMEEAVERFEGAVRSRGGDLMVDEGPRGRTTQPDDPHFGLPRRDPHETVDHYLERLAYRTDSVLHHPRKE